MFRIAPVFPLAALVFCAAQLTASPARAAWTKRSDAGSTHLSALSAPDAANVFVAGYDVQQNGMSFRLPPRVFASDDGGRSLTDISGQLAAGASLDRTNAVHFHDASTGWLAVGKKVHRTGDRGTTWTAASLGMEPLALHFTDAQKGIAAGKGGQIARTSDGGATWQTVQSPTTVDLRRLYFLDASRGWALGYLGDEFEEEDLPRNGVLLRTTDGGDTWNLGWSEAGLIPTSIHFLCDGKTGFLGVWKKPGSAFEAALLKTTDGGISFEDTHLPLEVGQFQFIGTNPIRTGKILAQAWDDALRGRLAAAAFVMEGSSGSSGGGSSSTQKDRIWRVVDYETEDGGESWTKTDLGLISASFSTLPPSDGDFTAGLFRDRRGGWLVGGSGAVRTDAAFCADDFACDEGYVCTESGCVRASPVCASQGGNGGGDGGGGDKPGGVKYPGPTWDAPAAETGGCGCAGEGASAAALLGLALARLARRRG